MIPFSNNQLVIELGGGNKPLYHPNLDIRKMPTVDIVADLNERLPIADNTYDGVYSSYMIEHVSWRKVRHLISETCRILKPGGRCFFITANLYEQARKLASTDQWADDDVCMIFGDQNYIGDDWRANSHTCGFSPAFATQLFREAGFSDIAIIAHPNCRTDMIIEAVKSTQPNIDTQLKLNIGSFTVMWGDNWINLDIAPLEAWASERGYAFKRHDVRTGIPYLDQSVDLITTSHFLEHLTYDDGRAFLTECHRVMKPGAVMRIAVPDAGLLAQCYLSRLMDRFNSTNDECAATPYMARKLWALLLAGHSAIYDADTLLSTLQSIGFRCQRSAVDSSVSPIIKAQTKDLFVEHSLYVEAVKQATS